MTETASYAGFAAQHTDELLRMGWLLTGDWSAAEDLVQTTLAHAYLNWARVDEPQHAAWVRSLLLRTFLHSRASGTADTTDPLQQALAQLPRRARAVTVLRDYAGLSEQQTAAELHCSPVAVHRDEESARGRLRALSDDPSRLGERLRELTPDPPADTGVRQAGSGGFTVPGSRPTSVWVAFALTAVLVAVLAVIVLAIRHPGPEDGSGLPPSSARSVTSSASP